MYRSRVEMYVHMVWATFRRAEFLRAELEHQAYAVIITEAEKLRCEVLAVGGMPDHVHLVIRMPAAVTVAQIAKAVKGTSSNFINANFRLDEYFAWQER